MNTVASRGSQVAMRIALSLTLGVSGVVHAYLFIHGYRHIPSVGTAFLIQGSAFIASAVLILAGGPRWLQWVAGVAGLGSLVAFGMSRTIGLLGFVEQGWDSPYGPIAVGSEALAVLLVAASSATPRRRRGPRSALTAAAS